MDNAKAIRVFVYSDGAGSFAAATSESPFFCFEGTSEADVLREAERALDFYASAKTEPVRAARAPASLRRFSRVREAELAIA